MGSLVATDQQHHREAQDELNKDISLDMKPLNPKPAHSVAEEAAAMLRMDTQL